jgi:hypothetical protein
MEDQEMPKGILRLTLGWMMIGDGLAAFFAPEAYMRRWQVGDGFIDDLLEYFVQNPSVTRGVAIAEVVAGVTFGEIIPTKHYERDAGLAVRGINAQNLYHSDSCHWPVRGYHTLGPPR